MFNSLYTKCTDCDGTGIALTSVCCDAKFDNDIRICEECFEHLGDNECTSCEGTGRELKHIDTKNDY